MRNQLPVRSTQFSFPMWKCAIALLFQDRSGGQGEGQITDRSRQRVGRGSFLGTGYGRPPDDGKRDHPWLGFPFVE
jgi:hypothetical protein